SPPHQGGIVPVFPPGAVALVRRQAQKYILSGLRRGLSGNEIQNILQTKALGYRRQAIQSDVRYWQAGLQKADHLKFVNYNARPSNRLYMQTGWQTKGRYETVVEVKYRNRLTGEVTSQDVTVVHTHTIDGEERPALTQDMTRGEIETAAESMVQTGSPGGPVEIVSSKSIFGFYNPDIG
ncbi:unnamed protein product, partial [marine sediment metagenome]